MWLNPVNIQGRDLPDAWFQAIDARVRLCKSQR
jgi:hypothetical protein